MIAIIVVIIRQLFFTSSVIIIHFGKNPVSGGSPPKDNKMSEVIVNAIGVLFHRRDIELIVIEEFSINVKNIGIVSRI